MSVPYGATPMRALPRGGSYGSILLVKRELSVCKGCGRSLGNTGRSRFTVLQLMWRQQQWDVDLTSVTSRIVTITPQHFCDVINSVLRRDKPTLSALLNKT